MMIMKVNELIKGKQYVHTGFMFEARRNDPLRFVELREWFGRDTAVFVWDNGIEIRVIDWAVERYVEEYKKVKD
jgi:hypothetical protein